MEKGINLRIKEFNDDIVAAINKAKLPLKIAGIILTNYANSINIVGDRAVEAELKAYEKESAEDGKEIH
jgi:hypothetical protein